LQKAFTSSNLISRECVQLIKLCFPVRSSEILHSDANSYHHHDLFSDADVPACALTHVMSGSCDAGASFRKLVGPARILLVFCEIWLYCSAVPTS
jgi:hypothetical protein